MVGVLGTRQALPSCSPGPEKEYEEGRVPLVSPYQIWQTPKLASLIERRRSRVCR